MLVVCAGELGFVAPWKTAGTRRRGASTVEYLLLVGMITFASVLGFRAFGGAVSGAVWCQARPLVRLDGGGCAADPSDSELWARASAPIAAAATRSDSGAGV